MRRSSIGGALKVVTAFLFIAISGLGMAQNDSYATVTALREDPRIKFSHKVQRMVGPTCQIAQQSFVATSGMVPAMYSCYIISRNDQQKVLGKLIGDVRGAGWMALVANETPNPYGTTMYNFVFTSTKGMMSITYGQFDNSTYLMAVGLIR